MSDTSDKTIALSKLPSGSDILVVRESEPENVLPPVGAKLLWHRGFDHASAGKTEGDEHELQASVEEVAGRTLTVQLNEAVEATIVWVQLRACAIEVSPFEDLRAVFSPPGKQVAGFSKTKRDSAWAEAGREVKQALGDGAQQP